MASKYRRKQSQPRRIIRRNEAGTKSKISYVVVDKKPDLLLSDTKYRNNANNCFLEDSIAISTPLNGDQGEDLTNSHHNIEHPETGSETHTNLTIPQVDYGLSEDSRSINSNIHLPLSFESFQNVALINFAINQEFIRKSALPNHEYHQETYPCCFCGQSFPEKTTLDVHIQVFHAGGCASEKATNEQYSCSDCGKSFNQQWNLTQHKKSHDNQTKTFPCPYCHKVFSHDCNRKIHLRSHTGEKPFRCEICGRKFSHKHNMRVHMRTHTREKPYQCPHCPKAFAHVSALKIHGRIHSGERPYTCEDCGKEFSHSSTLSVHRRRHLEEKHA